MGKKYSELTEEEKAARRAHRRKWHAANREKSKEVMRRWAAKNPEKVRARARRWAAANPGKAKERVRKWRVANPEKAAAAGRKWVAANPEKTRATEARRRQKKKLGPLGMAMKITQGMAKAETA